MDGGQKAKKWKSELAKELGKFTGSFENIFFILGARVLGLHVHMCTTWHMAGAHRSQKKASGYLGTGAAHSCEPPCGCSELSPGGAARALNHRAMAASVQPHQQNSQSLLSSCGS